MVVLLIRIGEFSVDVRVLWCRGKPSPRPRSLGDKKILLVWDRDG
jgi:hypothetical protein